MHWRRRLLKNSKLYVILDTEVCDYDRLFDVAKKSLKGGADIFQLRDKKGLPKNILAFSRKILALLNKKALFVINDRVDLTLASGSDGVHLGQEDLTCSFARDILGKDKLIGVSCQAYEHVKKAQNDGADYIGFGSIFKTLTKPDRDPMNLSFLEKIVHRTRLPLFAIGGIDLKNMAMVARHGVNRIAICRAICNAKDVGKITKAFKDFLVS